MLELRDYQSTTNRWRSRLYASNKKEPNGFSDRNRQDGPCCNNDAKEHKEKGLVFLFFIVHQNELLG